MGQITGKQRIAKAMRHGIPDRVPLMCQLALGHYFLNTDLKPHEIWFTSEGFAEALVTLQQRYHFDGILINLPGRAAHWDKDITSITEDESGEVVKWVNGDVTRIPWNDNPNHFPAKSSLTFPKFETFDPVKDFNRIDDWVMFPFNVYGTPLLSDKSPGLLDEIPGYFLNTIKMVQQKVSEEISVQGEVFSPFSLYLNLFEYQEALLNLIADPGKVVAILSLLTEAAIQWGVIQAKCGVDAIVISSPFAGSGFISKKMYQQFVQPFEKLLVEQVHSQVPGVLVYTHTCGHINDRLELMMETGIDGLDTLDPPPIGDVELTDAKKRVGYQLFIKGNMDAIELLKARSIKEVQEQAKACLRAGMPGGGYILSTACSVSPLMAPEKLESLFPLVEKYGRY
jgi:hypothetical protein